MAKQLDPSLFEEESASEAGPKQIPTFEEQPIYASGLTPETAINKSPVELVDRLRYSLGNTPGMQKDLAQKFPEGVQQDAKGNFSIKKDGVWYRADAKGLGDGDAWERTNELIKDATEIGPQLIKNTLIGTYTGFKTGGRTGAIAGGVLAAAATVGMDAYSEEVTDFVKAHPVVAGSAATILGAVGIKGLKAQGLKGVTKDALPAMIIGAGAEAARTSLGRLVGTYEASFSEQAADIGLESLYNFGSAAIAAGVKPSGKTLAKMGDTISKGFSEAPEQSLKITSSVLGPLSGAGADNIEIISKRPEQYRQVFRQSVEGARSSEEAIGTAIMHQVGDVKELINGIPKVLSHQYVNMSHGVVNSVDDTFIASKKEGVEAIWKHAANLGIGKLKLQAGSSGATPKIIGFAFNNDDQIAEAASRALRAGNTESAEWLTGLIKNGDAKKYVRNYIQTVAAHRGSPVETGANGARALIHFKKALNSRLYELEKEAGEKGITSASGILKSLDDQFDTFLEGKFMPKDPKAPNLFTQFNKTYSVMKDNLTPMLKVREAAARARTDQPYLDLLNKVSNDNRSGILKRSAFHRLVTEVNPATGKVLLDSNMRDIYLRIMDREAVKATIPYIRTQALGKYGPVGLIGGAAFVNPQIAAGMGLGLAATSPRLAGKTTMAVAAGAQFLKNKDAAVRQFLEGAAQKMGDIRAVKTLVDVAGKGLQFTQKLATSGQMGEMMKNEELMKAYAQTLFNGLHGTYRTEQKLMSQVPQ